MATAAKIDDRILRPIESGARRIEIVSAIEAHDISLDPGWPQLDALSTRTEFDSLEAVPEGIFDAGDNRFEAAATVYVTLNYEDGTEDISAPETFPAHVKGHFSQEGAVIDSVEVNASRLDEGQ